MQGYNFPSIESITPFLEPTKSGISTQWAIETAAKLNCIVIVGYPELDTTDAPANPIPAPLPGAEIPAQTPHEILPDASTPILASTPADPSARKRYNSVITVAPTGIILAHYRKSFLYYTDETWASEGPTGFTTIPLCSLPAPPLSSSATYLSRVTQGICMDINPYKFTAPWTAFEFANHVLANQAQMAIVSMAWLVNAQPEDWEREMTERGEEIEISTLTYWVERFKVVTERMEGNPVIVVCANRAGIEGSSCYAGSSVVMRLGKGDVEIMGYAGKGEERVLLVDLEEGPKYRLKTAPTDTMNREGGG